MIPNTLPSRWPALLASAALALPLIHAQAQSPSVWNGGGANDQWSNPANWGGNTPIPDMAYDLQFAGTSRLTPINDIAAGSGFQNITFNPGAGAFAISGNSISLGGDVMNSSTSLQTLNLPITATSVRTITTSPAGGDLSLGGDISGSGGGLTKAGLGALSLSGALSYSGATTVDEGVMSLTGSLTNAGAVNVNQGTLNLNGPASNTGSWQVGGPGKAILNIGPGGSLYKASGNFRIGVGADTFGAVNIKGGSFTTRSAWSFNNFGIAGSGYGALTISDGATVDSRGFIFGTVNTPASIGIGAISGGTVTVDNHVVIPYYGGIGVLTVQKDGVFLRTSGAGNLNVNQKGNGRGELNLLGGTINNGDGSIGFGTGSSPIDGGIGSVNINTGVLTTARFHAGQGHARINFNGGTLRAGTNRTDFLPTSIDSVVVNGPFETFQGGGTIDTAGWSIEVHGGLLAPTGEGVKSITVADGGSGYIGAPYVWVVDNNGFGIGATAIANMVDDGTGNGTYKVGSVTVTSPGVDYTSGAASYTFAGGSPSVAATPGVITTGPNTSGGLTKIGEGTLTLHNINTYTGPTVVSGGTLLLNGQLGSGPVTVQQSGVLSGSGIVGGNLALENGGTLSPGDGVGTLTINGNLSINGSAMVFDVLDAINSDRVVVNGNLSAQGVTPINLANAAVLQNGDYNLIQVTGTLGGSAANFQVSSPNPTKVYSIVYQGKAVVLRVAAGAPTLTWAGTGNTWDIGTSMNWLNGGVPSTFNNQDGALFTETGAAQPVVNVAAKVSPGVLTVNSATDYTLTGNGGIAGSGDVFKDGPGALTIATANEFTGNLYLKAGTLNLNHPSATGKGGFIISGGTIDNTSGAAVVLTNNNPQSWEADFAFTGTGDLNLGNGEVALAASPTITVNNRKLTIGGNIVGLDGITKAGPGSLILDGTNSYSGSTTVSDGQLVLNGSQAIPGPVTLVGGSTMISGRVDGGTGQWNIGGDVTPAVLKVGPGAEIFKNGYFRIGYDSGSKGAVHFSGGTYTNLAVWNFNNFSIGHFGYGAVTVSGGIVDTRGFILGGGTDSSGAALGIVDISGGTVVVDANVVVAYNGGTGVLTVGTNGILARTTAGNLGLNQKGSLRAEVNVTGGTLDVNGGYVVFASSTTGTDGGFAAVNLDSGTLRTLRFQSSALGQSRVNFNGGTLKPSLSRTDFLPSTIGAVYVNGPFGGYAGGAVIDTDSGDNTIEASLLAPTGEGVRTLTVTSAGSGYIGAPYVSIVDDSGTGSGAMAIAVMADDGTGKGTLKVQSIRVTNPGVNYTPGSTRFTLVGGNAVVEATPGAATTAPNTSGGLTKLGAGTLTLSGANSYTGPTAVNGGLLLINGSLAPESAVTVGGGALGGNGTISGPVTVQAGGTLAPGTGLGGLTLGNSLTLTAGSTVHVEVDKSTATSDLVTASSVTYAGTLLVTNLAGTLAPGDMFQLFNTPVRNGNFSSIIVPGANATFDPATGTLTITELVTNQPTDLTFSISGNVLSMEWPESHRGWHAQSNSVDVANSQMWFDIPGSASGTNLVITIDPAMQKVFYRLRNP